MVKKLFLAFLAFSLVVTFTGCEEFMDWLLAGTTGVEGKLELAAGVEGDLDDTEVYLYDNSDFEGSAEESEKAVEDEDDETEATFEFEDIDEDDYYLLAWKDLDDDDEISYGDLVGIYDGKYGEDEPEEIEVEEGEMSDVGTIKMYENEGGGGGDEVSVTAYGTIYGDGYLLTYIYTFNVDVTLDYFDITLPGYEPFYDSDEYGFREGGKDYTTQEYAIYDNEGNYYPIPTGTHTLYLEGTVDGEFFWLEEDISVY